MRCPFLPVFTALALLASPAAAQHMAAPPRTLAALEFDSAERLPAPTAVRVPRSGADDLTLITAGVLGGAAGVLAGGLVGAKLTQDQCEDCALEGLVYGGLVGGLAGMPLAVHVANGGRGSLAGVLLASLAVGGAGVAAVAATGESRIMLAVPIAQLATAIAFERATTRRRTPSGPPI